MITAVVALTVGLFGAIYLLYRRFRSFKPLADSESQANLEIAACTKGEVSDHHHESLFSVNSTTSTMAHSELSVRSLAHSTQSSVPVRLCLSEAIVSEKLSLLFEKCPQSPSKKKRDTALQQKIMQASERLVSGWLVVDCILNVTSTALELNDVHISTALHRIASTFSKSSEKSKISRSLRSDGRFKNLRNLACNILSSTTPRVVSTIAWSMGKLDFYDNGLMTRIDDYMVTNLSSFDARGIANTLYAYGLLNYRGESEKTLEIVTEHLPSRLSDMKPQEISNSVYALSRLGYLSCSLFESVADFTKKKLSEYKYQEMANLIFSFSNLGVKNVDLFKAVESELIKRGITACLSQDISNTLTAFGKVKIPCDSLCAAVCSPEGIARLNGFSPQALANCLAALTELKFFSDDYFIAAVDSFRQSLNSRKVTISECVVISEALAASKYDAEKFPIVAWLMSDITQFILENMKILKPHDFSIILLSIISLRYHTNLINAATPYTCSRINEFRPNSLITLTKAFAIFGYIQPELSEVIVRRIKQSNFAFSELIDIAFDLASLGITDNEISEEILKEIDCDHIHLCKAFAIVVESQNSESIKIVSKSLSALQDEVELETIEEFAVIAKTLKIVVRSEQKDNPILLNIFKKNAKFAKPSECSEICLYLNNSAIAFETKQSIISSIVQVNMVIHMNEYSVEEIKTVLDACSSFSAFEAGDSLISFLQEVVHERLCMLTVDEISILTSAIQNFVYKKAANEHYRT